MAPRPAAPATPPAVTSVRTWWAGDPSILVFAFRYALGRRGCHGPELVRQAIDANAHNLPEPARKTIAREVREWLDEDGRQSPDADRTTWKAVLERVERNERARGRR